jgi:hypothetical protein
MNWYWRVRIYNAKGNYGGTEIMTAQNLTEIATIKEFYETLTGCKMLIEGMSQKESTISRLENVFRTLWTEKE